VVAEAVASVGEDCAVFVVGSMVGMMMEDGKRRYMERGLGISGIAYEAGVLRMHLGQLEELPRLIRFI